MHCISVHQDLPGQSGLQNKQTALVKEDSTNQNMWHEGEGCMSRHAHQLSLGKVDSPLLYRHLGLWLGHGNFEAVRWGRSAG
jgi:hypothetical protein